MANLSITNTFTAGTTIVASEVNTNFTDVSTYINDRNGATADWDFLSSAGVITAKDGVRSSDESAATPAYSFTSDTDTGIFRVSANAMGISTGGTSRVTIENTITTISTNSLRIEDGNATSPSLTFSNETNTGIFRASGDTLGITTGATEVGRFDANATAGNTRFLVYDVDNATLERVSVGAADSGGVGFKVLRIPN